MRELLSGMQTRYCKKCDKEVLERDGRIHDYGHLPGQTLCADCYEKKHGLYWSGPGLIEGQVMGKDGKALTGRAAKASMLYVRQCSKCKKVMATGNPPRNYKKKDYCDQCYEDVRMKNQPERTCSRCHSEYKPNIDYSSPSWKNENVDNYKGKKLCPKCLRVQQLEDAAASSKAFRDRMIADKDRAEKRKLIKPSPKSRFQSIIEDRQRVIQLIKERNR